MLFLRSIALGCAATLVAGGLAVRAADDPAELRAALDAALERAGRLETELAQRRQANAALARSLAAANEDSRAAREELRKLRTDLEALGVSVFDPNDREARKRLIAAVAEATREREARGLLEQQLLQLSESVVLFLGKLGDIDPAQRAGIEAELRAADKVLAETRLAAGAAGSGPAATPLAEARVVSLNPELGLVVLNIGSRSGVRLGMPVEIRRNDRVLGSGLVADVRDAVCGVVPGDPGFPVAEVKVGDQARPRVQ